MPSDQIRANRPRRRQLIEAIEKLRKSKVIVYFTSDRGKMSADIAPDIFPVLHKHLTNIGEQNNIDLFLYSTGGSVMAGYTLVNLFREFCQKFNVIIPFRALSSATLISLGADEIVMTKMGQLSPIDPSITHSLCNYVEYPKIGIQGLVPVSVEDVNAFLNLAKEEFALSEETSMKFVFDKLSSSLNPLVLGMVQRSRAQIGFLATQLMKHHTDDKKNIERLVKILTRERFSHDYIISRTEAKEVLKLNVIDPSESLTSDIIELFNEYEDILQMGVPYSPAAVTEAAAESDQRNDENKYEFNLAVIESSQMTHVYKKRMEIKKVTVQLPNMPTPQTGYTEEELEKSWRLIDDTP